MHVTPTVSVAGDMIGCVIPLFCGYVIRVVPIVTVSGGIFYFFISYLL